MKTLFALILLALAASAQAQTTNRFAATIFKALTNDLAITNQTNMTVATDLTVSVEPNKKYAFQLLPFLSASVSGTEVQVVASNATVYGTWNGQGSSFAGSQPMTNAQSFTLTTARGVVQFFYVIGGTNTNAGTISVQFRSSIATNTNTFHTGSFMRADKVP